MLDSLAALAPVEAVFGNVDDAHDPSLARERVVTIGGVTIHVSHGHELGPPTAELMLARYRGDVVIFGHTHKAVVVRDAGGRVGVQSRRGRSAAVRSDAERRAADDHRRRPADDRRRDYFAGVNSIVISGSRLIFSPLALSRTALASAGVAATA